MKFVPKACGVKVVWEAKVNPTGFMKRLHLVSGKRKIKTPEVILKLREFAYPKDGMIDTGRDRNHASATCAILRPAWSATV
jgi:hypothetical protein